jgi:hypothetical protein
MRFGKTEIAAQRAAGAHAHIGDFGLHPSQHSRFSFTTGERSMARCVASTDLENCFSARSAQSAIVFTSMDVVAQKIVSGQQQLCPAGVQFFHLTH